MKEKTEKLLERFAVNTDASKSVNQWAKYACGQQETSKRSSTLREAKDVDIGGLRKKKVRN